LEESKNRWEKEKEKKRERERERVRERERDRERERSAAASKQNLANKCNSVVCLPRVVVGREEEEEESLTAIFQQPSGREGWKEGFQLQSDQSKQNS
jgi:hypothetical protein